MRKKNETEYTVRRLDDHLLFYGLRVVNFRPIFLLALSLAAGIGCFYCFGVYSFLFNIVMAPAVVGFILILKKKGRKIAGIFLAFTALCCAVFSVGAVGLSVRISDFDSDPFCSGSYMAEGTLDEIGRTSDSSVYTFKDVEMFNVDTAEIVKAKGRLRVYVYGDAGLEAGDRVTFLVDVETYETWTYGRINASAILDDVRYRATAQSEDFSVSGKESANVFTVINLYVQKTLFSGMSRSNASLAYAMLTGNSGFMDDDVLQNFRYGGIAHIFAVSGLHIGVIYAILSFFLQRVCRNKPVRFFVTSAVLIFYSGICGFSPSSVRALVMCMILSVMQLSGAQYDRLNSVSFAVLTVLAINPVFLFSVGFLLSVAASGGIIVLGEHLSRQLTRIPHFPRRFAYALGTAVSAQIATFPVLVDTFGYASALSLVLNLIFIPVISAAYAVMFVGGLLACILPFASHIILFLPEYILQLSVLPVMMLDLKFLLIFGFSFGGCSVLWYVGMYFVSDKINLRVWVKLIGMVLLSGAFVCCMFSRNWVSEYEGMLTVHGYYGSNFVLMRENGQITMISFGVPDADHLEQAFLKRGVTRVDVLVSVASADETNAAVPVILSVVPVQKFIVNADVGFVNSFRTLQCEEADGFFEIGGYESVFAADEVLYMNYGGADILFVNTMPEDRALPFCDVLLSVSEIGTQEIVRQGGVAVCFERSDDGLSVYRYGDLLIGRRDGIISVKGLG